MDSILDAVRSGNLEKIQALLDENPDLVNARNEFGQSPVLLAKYHRREEVVRLLLERGATLNIHEAAAVGDSSRMMELLEADAALLNAYSGDGFTPLGLAAFFGNARAVHNLLAKGAGPNLASNNPMRVCPLHSAVAGRHMEIVRMLVEAGADVNARQQQGFTPLHGAAQAGDEEMARFLLGNGAHHQTRSDAGQTALDLAMTHGHAGVAALLTED